MSGFHCDLCRFTFSFRSKYDHHLNNASHQHRQCMSEIMDVNESSQISDTDHYEQLQMNNVEYESDPTVRSFSGLM